MTRTKMIEAEPAPKTAVPEKIIEVDDETVIEPEDKPDVPIIPGTEPEDDDAEEDETLDTEEIDPFGDTWEQ